MAGDRAKIMDFGIARVRTSDVKTQTGLLLGSPKYMSPEQVLGKGIESRSDIFSLGVVLSEMLSGIAPFSGESVHQLMYQVCNTRPTPPSHLNPLVPPVVDLIVAKALEKDPAARYADAAEMASDLRRALGGGQHHRIPGDPCAGPHAGDRTDTRGRANAGAGTDACDRAGARAVDARHRPSPVAPLRLGRGHPAIVRSAWRGSSRDVAGGHRAKRRIAFRSRPPRRRLLRHRRHRPRRVHRPRLTERTNPPSRCAASHNRVSTWGRRLPLSVLEGEAP